MNWSEVVTLVDIVPSDSDTRWHFIRDSWLKSFRDSPWAGCVPNNLYWPTYTEAVEQLASESRVVAVVSKDDPDTIVAWICAEPQKGIVHYAFVKHRFRQMGLLRLLLQSVMGRDSGLTLTYRSRSPVFNYYRAKRAWKHDPVPARTKKREQHNANHEGVPAGASENRPGVRNDPSSGAQCPSGQCPAGCMGGCGRGYPAGAVQVPDGGDRAISGPGPVE